MHTYYKYNNTTNTAIENIYKWNDAIFILGAKIVDGLGGRQ